MKPRKFATGQHVTVTPNRLVAALTGGAFTVVRPLPENGGVWQYRPETGRLEVFVRGFLNESCGRVYFVERHGRSSSDID